MVTLFIDTNVFLSFYAFSPDDLSRLNGLAEQVERNEVVVFTTAQIEDEFRRNREAKIHTATKDLRGRRLDLGLPRLCDSYPETNQLKQLAREYATLHDQVVARLDRETQDRTLNADHAVQKILDGAVLLDTGPGIVDLARMRLDCGNPPGKRGSLGDAINWEALLAKETQDDLYFVTDDSDYYSPLGKPRPNEFLVQEWERVVGTRLLLVQRLSDLQSVLPKESLPVEDVADERDQLVGQLAESGNFSVTHALVAQLDRFPSFTAQQTRRIADALKNPQVRWILGDRDVKDFYGKLLREHAASLDPEAAGFLRDLLAATDEAGGADGELPG